MLAYDYPPISRRPAFMFALQCIPWVIGRSALWILTFSMVRNTPRTTTSVKLPSNALSDFMLRGFIIAELLITAPLSLGAGIAFEKRKFDAYFIINAILNTCHIIQTVILGSGMWFFGGQMVSLAQQNRMEMKSQRGLDGLASVMNLDAKLGKAIVKMQMSILAGILSLGWYTINLVLFAHLPDWSMSIRWWSTMQCISGYVLVPVLFWGAQIVILWAEIKPKETPTDVAGLLTVIRDHKKTQYLVYRTRTNSSSRADGDPCGGDFCPRPGDYTPPTPFPLTDEEEALRPMLLTRRDSMAHTGAMRGHVPGR
ncbi:hypothetical protein HDU86_002637 [Geranomyces michiganensis]|nr:hypothetical protein HDU86_002637 [Geranomyces michiganensis]